MVRISQLAGRVGLSRTTLLYYEKIGLIRGRRLANGYRDYDDEDLQRLLFAKELQAAGLTLGECIAFFEGGIDRELLRRRHDELTEEIESKRRALSLLEALLGRRREGLRALHERLDRVAPEAHAAWLRREGFGEDDIFHLRWLSRNYTEHEDYMDDFFRIFDGLETHGPASEKDTLAALALLPEAPSSILDIGCGPGNATLLLARHTQATVHALDNHGPSLERLARRAAEAGLEERIRTVNAGMEAPPFPPGSFDLIWSENSVYVIGFEKALSIWKPLLGEGGAMVVSDLLWLRDAPAEDVKAFWRDEYPDMTNRETRISQIEALGYELVGTHALGHEAWANYYGPLAARTDALRDEMPGSEAIASIDGEVEMLRRQAEGDFNYVFFALVPRR